jgi:AraC-like DNA-binding protein
LILPGRREENVPDILGQSSDTSRPRLRNSLPASYPKQDVEISDPGPDNLLERVRAQLAPGPDGYADLERVAGRLFMSGRTLKRKLQDRGTTFRALLDDARFRQAQHLLENPDLDIQQVAAALGYRDPACFTRAFRRWSGRTPSQARAARKAVERPRSEAEPSEARAPAKGVLI